MNPEEDATRKSERRLTVKKTVSVFCLFLVLSMVFSVAGYAAGDNYDTLADWERYDSGAERK